jgi:hypothetical protein
MISFWFRKNRKVVTMEALREEDTKGLLGWIWTRSGMRIWRRWRKITHLF